MSKLKDLISLPKGGKKDEAKYIRSLMREDLHQDRMIHPRKKLSRPISFYLESIEKGIVRPAVALHQLARITELMVAHTRSSRCDLTQSEKAQRESLFVEVRKAERNLLVSYNIKRDLPHGAVIHLRKTVAELYVQIRDVLNSTSSHHRSKPLPSKIPKRFQPPPTTGRPKHKPIEVECDTVSIIRPAAEDAHLYERCPCCHGCGSLHVDDALIIRRILREAVDRNEIPVELLSRMDRIILEQQKLLKKD